MLPQTDTRRVWIALVALGLLCAGVAGQPASEGNQTAMSEFVITSETHAGTPVTPLLYSHFIEVGYGIQVEPMWSQMLFNRSFEPFTPYKHINIEWFDLWKEPGNPAAGYHTDWSVFDWYHSGYEHNVWFAAPGPLTRQPIDKQSTFIVTESPDADALLQPTQGKGVHGTHEMRFINNETERWAGMAQDGKVLRKKTRYRWSGWLRGDAAHPLRAEVRLYPEDDWENPIATAKLEPVGPQLKRHEAVLESGDFEGRAVFALFMEPESAVLCDAFSLVPEQTANGWRPEVIEAARRVNPGVLRWPGGCFASFSDWRESVGPHDERVPRPSWFWGGYNYNDVGVGEIHDLCKAIGSEIMYCVNMHHPLKRAWDHHLSEERRYPHGFDLPEFSDLEQGAREAAALVAYCNTPADHPLGALRASHGHPEPFNIRYWELDNEAHRWFEAREYARACVLYSKAMKAVDPTIQVGMQTYAGEFEQHLPEMLEIAGPYIDFMADRAYGQTHLNWKLDRMREYNKKHEGNIRYCNTEWLAFEDAPDAYNVPDLPEGGPTKSFMFSKWRYALNVVRNHMMWQREGGDVLFINFNNFANTHAQSTIETPKEGVWLAATGRVFELLSRTGITWPLVIDDYKPDNDNDLFLVQAGWNAERDALIVLAVNMTDDARPVRFDTSTLDKDFETAQIATLHAEQPVEKIPSTAEL